MCFNEPLFFFSFFFKKKSKVVEYSSKSIRGQSWYIYRSSFCENHGFIPLTSKSSMHNPNRRIKDTK